MEGHRTNYYDLTVNYFTRTRPGRVSALQIIFVDKKQENILREAPTTLWGVSPL
jgi:hypothetical protein